MIARVWKGVARDAANADAYLRHLAANVLPALATIEGYREVRVLRRADHGRVEFLVLTFWDSMEAIRRFAGADPQRAVVEPEARAVLAEYDDVVRHYEVMAKKLGVEVKLNTEANAKLMRSLLHQYDVCVVASGSRIELAAYAGIEGHERLVDALAVAHGRVQAGKRVVI